MLANADVREMAQAKGVRLWEIADRLRISDPTMTRKLRKELTPREKEFYFNLIDDIAAAKQTSDK